MRSAAPLPEAFDVIVVGGGGSGLAAAVAAAEAGASVLLLEKAARLGGSTSLAVGSVAAAGTREQRDARITDTPEQHAADSAALGATRPGTDNAELRDLLVHEAPATIEWLRGWGVVFAGPGPAAGMATPRMLNIVPSARAAVEALRLAAAHRGVTVRTGARVTALAMTDGRVLGVDVADRRGLTRRMGARGGVILATGSFPADADLRARWIGAEAAAIEPLDPTQEGDGHRLTAAAGAALVNLGAGTIPDLRFVTPPSRLRARPAAASPLAARLVRVALRALPRSLALRVLRPLLTSDTAPSPRLFESGAILVNRHGERFTDELAPFQYAVAQQPEGLAWILLDDALARRFDGWPEVVSTSPGIGYASVADYRHLRPDVSRSGDLAQVAARAGLPPEALAATVRHWNEAASAGTPDPFGRTDHGPGLATPPYHLLGPARTWFVESQGGPVVDRACRVLDEDGLAIPGLFGAGALAKGSMRYGGAGYDLTWAFTSGRVAGAEAAKAGAAAAPTALRPEARPAGLDNSGA